MKTVFLMGSKVPDGECETLCQSIHAAELNSLWIQLKWDYFLFFACVNQTKCDMGYSLDYPTLFQLYGRHTLKWTNLASASHLTLPIIPVFTSSLPDSITYIDP